MIIHHASDFETNNIEFQTKFIGNEQNLILIVDNVFKNPDLVLEKIKEYPVINNDDKFENLFPGYVTYLTLPNWHLDKIFSMALYNFFLVDDEVKPQLRLNIIDNKKLVYDKCLLPHTDVVRYAGQMYLCDYPNSYTAFYRYKKSGSESKRSDWKYKQELIDIYSQYEKERCNTLYDRKQNGKFVPYDSIDDDGIWECYHKEPVVKNRLVIHAGNLYHSAYLKHKYDYDDLRYSIALFA